MIKLLWIIDGVGWGFDNLFNAIRRELSNYQHISIKREWNDDTFTKVIDEINADIIISLSQRNIGCINNKKRAIIGLPGIRSLTKWRR